MTRQESLEEVATLPIPEPFHSHLGAVNSAIDSMREAAALLSVRRQFTSDGRFLGDLGEVLVTLHFGINLHLTQMEGEDGVCHVSGKKVEIKLRSKSTLVWVKKVPDLLVAVYLSPLTFKWGVVCNGPGDLLLRSAKWDDQHKRYITDLHKLLHAQNSLSPDSPRLMPAR